MASCKYVVAATESESTANGTTTVTHSSGFVIGEAIKISCKYNKNDLEQWADDALKDSDKSFKDGTLTFDARSISLANRTTLLGHTAATSPAVGFTGKTSDTVPFFGVGFIHQESSSAFWAFWYTKVQFSEPEDTYETKTKEKSFGTKTIEGTIMQDGTGEWIQVQEFTTEALAIAWLNGLAGITSSNGSSETSD